MTTHTVMQFLQDLFGPMRGLWAVMGACVGSFISVVAYRLPIILEAREQGLPPPLSLSLPPSTCPACQRRLAWRDNLPVVGYLVNRGQCRQCAAPIPVRYLLLELVGAGWALGATFLWHDPVQVLAWSVFGWYLIALAWTDAESKWLPDVMTLGLLWLGLWHSTTANSLITPTAAIYAAAGTFLILQAASQLFTAVRGKEGLAGGDIKLLAAFAAWLGASATVHLATAAFAVVILQAVLLRSKGAQTHAFGPALCLCAAGAAIWHAPGVW